MLVNEELHAIKENNKSNTTQTLTSFEICVQNRIKKFTLTKQNTNNLTLENRSVNHDLDDDPNISKTAK